MSFRCLGCLAAAILLPVLLAGCGDSRRVIALESEPPGMRVEVNGKEIGQTPLAYEVASTSTGEFAGAVGEATCLEITAFPPRNERALYSQRKVFRVSGLSQAGDKVPEHVVFDMRQPPEIQKLD